MSQVTQPFAKFRDQTDAAGKQIHATVTAVDARVAKISRAVTTFRGVAEGSFSVNANCAALISPTLEAIRRDVRGWSQRVDEAMTGQEFVSRFDRSLIVAVYGIVNSGKSSLGNFIGGASGGGATNPCPATPTTFHQLRADSDGQVEPVVTLPDGFGENRVECTRSIQWFTAGGLSWVDTPGTGSLTTAHGDLARRYVDHAELVVVVTSSSSPARNSELKQLRNLVRQKKPVLLVVTKCDEVTWEKDASGEVVQRRVMKKTRDLNDQEAWLRTTFAEHGLDRLFHTPEILFCSREIARLGLVSGDAEMVRSSGIPALLARLGSVLSEDAIGLKAAAPQQRVAALIEMTLRGGVSPFSDKNSADEDPDNAASHPVAMRGLDRLRDELLAVREPTAKAHGRVTGLTNIVVVDVMAKLAPAVQRCIETCEGADVTAEIREMAVKALRDAMTTRLRQVLTEFDEAILHAMPHVDVDSIPDVEDRYVEEPLDNSHLMRGRGQAVGGVIGATFGVFGGPVGAVVGSIVCAAIGDFVGGKLASPRVEKVKVGTNESAVVRDVLDRIETAITKQVGGYLPTLADDIFGPATDFVDRLLVAADTLEDEIEGQRIAQPDAWRKSA